VGLERGPFSIVSTIEELLGRNSSGSCLENREYGCGDLLSWPRNTLYLQKVGTNFANKRRSLGRIVRLWTKATEFTMFIRSWSINIVVCLLGNATNNLWVLDLTLDLLVIHQAELQLIITLSILLWL
jgi:hypothetical protein